MSTNHRKQQQQPNKKMYQHHRQRYCYRHNNKHRQHYFMSPIPKMQHQLQMPAFHMLRFLLLLVCYCCRHSQAAAPPEYSEKMDNCNAREYGFSGHHMFNDSVAIAHHMKWDTDNGTHPAWTDLEHPANGVFIRNETDVVGNHNVTPTWKCCCKTKQIEVECRCEGAALARIPQTLTLALQKLVIASTGLVRLRSTALKVYNLTLTDFTLTGVKYLETIQDGAFADLNRLRTIYISHAPKLAYLSKEVFKGISDTLINIRILNSGLTKMPNLVYLPPTTVLQMIDLDNNHITRIDSMSMKIKTDQLILANNDITYIDDSAFYGSRIAQLIVKDNRNLQQIHPNAFNGLIMRELDLSRTSITRLPSAGLQDIDTLRIENTHTLKTIPSIYNFKNLQKAFLTHSFHCCAFKFPSRHDPIRHAEHMDEIEKWQKQCNNKKNNGNDNRSKKSKKIKQQHTKQPFVTTNSGDVDYGSKERSAFLAQTWSTQVTDDGDDAFQFGSTNGFGTTGFGAIVTGTATDDGTIWQPTTHQLSAVVGTAASVAATTTSNNIDKSNLLESAKGILYSRLMRSEFPTKEEQTFDEVNMEPNEPVSGDEEYFVGDDEYLADSKKDEVGIFHAPVNHAGSSQRETYEYCGNFTLTSNVVECYPIPNALNPCEDVMGYQWLRISVWIVVSLAVIGNVAVLVVILSIKPESSSVPRFLMCHLAFADLCLGLYLLLIASIDSHSMGEYFNYAYDWQYGAGCKVAGFLTVFASHLSVFTLTVITIERWLAITHALYLNHRIKLRPAAYIMIGGWLYSIVMSSLPLFGISNYSSTSICLPMEDRDTFDTIYLVAIMGLNGLAFFIIAICYGQIYFSLGKETRHAHNTSTGEMSVARKMALLVFTNFACWAPIAFFGLTAISGYPLINVTKSKILLVFFYPLNSCADPYLYAILTAQYRQDLYTLLSKFGLCRQKAMHYKNSISFQANTNFTCSIQRHNSLIPKPQKTPTPPETEVMLKSKEDFV